MSILRPSPQQAGFALATLTPVVLLALAASLGGVWPALAVGYMTVLAFSLDRLVGTATSPADPAAEFPAANGLSVLLALAHLALLGLSISALAGGGLNLAEKLGLFFALGLFVGQVSNPNAHELIHRQAAGLRVLGVLVLASQLFGHHASAHRLVHHLHVGTDADPNSAPRGMSVYRFLPRAWVGSFLAGLAAENRVRRGRPLWTHPYLFYLAAAAGFLAAAFALGGRGGLAAYVLLALWGSAQLLVSDYVQHYGLRRAIGADGRQEPAGPHLSWNAPHWFTGRMMLNAPRHSDHHAHPARPYPALGIPAGAPLLPHSLPVMGLIALSPRRWRQLMDARALSASTPSDECEQKVQAHG